MAVSKQQARKVRLPVLTGELYLTGKLDGTTSEEVVELSSVASKVTIQSDGDLAGNITYSTNGIDFYGSTAFTATVPLSNSTHLIRVVKITRTGGSGKVHVVAV